MSRLRPAWITGNPEFPEVLFQSLNGRLRRQYRIDKTERARRHLRLKPPRPRPGPHRAGTVRNQQPPRAAARQCLLCLKRHRIRRPPRRICVRPAKIRTRPAAHGQSRTGQLRIMDFREAEVFRLRLLKREAARRLPLQRLLQRPLRNSRQRPQRNRSCPRRSLPTSGE